MAVFNLFVVPEFDSIEPAVSKLYGVSTLKKRNRPGGTVLTKAVTITGSNKMFIEI